MKNLKIFLYNLDDETKADSDDKIILDFMTGNFFERILSDDAIETFLTADLNCKDDESCLLIGASALLAFVQANFTGPDLKMSAVLEKQKLEEIHRNLSVDGEEINVNTKHAHLLVLSQKIWQHLVQKEPQSLIFNVWSLRHTLIHQKVLDEHCITLFERFKTTSTLILEKLADIPDVKDQVLINLEVVQGYLLYKRVFEADNLLKKMKESLHVEIEVKGMLGVRTKFQTKALPQLTLDVGRETYNQNHEIKFADETHSATVLPKLLSLDDDVRLERIKFNAEAANNTEQLDSVIQNVLLTTVIFLQLSQPKDNLSHEELQPYLTALLYQNHGPWLTRIQTLLINLKLESTHKRTVERSLKQCEDLVHLLSDENNAGVEHRFSYVFSTFTKPRWEIEAQLGELMVSLGMIKTALDLYLKLQLWEDVIMCYTLLQLRHKAADIIKQEIEKQPTVKLYCLLGDATDDVSWYETAWNFSNQKSGKAQRHWGSYYFAKKEYDKAIGHLEKSLEINSLQEIVWLRLGYAALQLENWELAAKAYRRYTQLEQHGFESWNNLAKAYIKLGDKKRAHKILQEALKCNFNNWMVWENFLLVSIDIGSFEDAINAYSRLTELKEKYHDEQILQIIVGAISNDIPDCNGMSSGRLKKKCLTLLGQQSAQNPVDGLTWKLSAQITDDPLQKAQKLQKAHRGFTQSQTSWVKEMKSCEKIIDICIDLCESSVAAAKNDIKESERMILLSQLSSARLAAMSCAKASKSENYESLNVKLVQLENLIAEIVELMKALK